MLLVWNTSMEVIIMIISIFPDISDKLLHLGACITCIRLKLMHGGWTKWIGSKGAAASTSVYLHANMASSKYDDDYVYAGVDEEDHPAVPRYGKV